MKTILHITPFYAPNIGGVETHLTDLISQLDKQNYRNIVLTYSPLTTNINYISHETINHIDIYRFKWIGYNLFHKLEKYPVVNFLYITPYLLIRSAIWITTNRPQIDIIHSHGINGALIGNILKKIFCIKKHIVSIYSSYDHVPLNSITTKLTTTILNSADKVLTQSNISIKQLTSLGVKSSLIDRYFHWIDLDRFKPNSKIKSKSFSILFVGRMIPQKNAYLLAKIAKTFPKVQFNFIGTGPDYQKIKKLNYKNIDLIGDIPYTQLHTYYQQATVLCVPSKYAEGWGRVLMESIACGTPVISSNLGATTEASDNTVAILINPTRNNLTEAIYKIQTVGLDLVKNCRSYALKHYSSKNIKHITKYY